MTSNTGLRYHHLEVETIEEVPHQGTYDDRTAVFRRSPPQIDTVVPPRKIFFGQMPKHEGLRNLWLTWHSKWYRDAVIEEDLKRDVRILEGWQRSTVDLWSQVRAAQKRDALWLEWTRHGFRLEAVNASLKKDPNILKEWSDVWREVDGARMYLALRQGKEANR
ncbi:hypothetical protein P389DRAFT_177812 [Cystobasidium minutum MCA 4210]|uniref:uncharacterized protein n=1 Tax=Cystobasidium minutum MCA 4210 TaxID=1397322 RepID=UPI0034CEC7AC|eukprot:jgi/Rhomi1/177812/fgenesh1_pg.2_\